MAPGLAARRRHGNAAATRPLLGAICAVLVPAQLLLFPAVAQAHVGVMPQRSSPGAAELYTVTVPAERPVPTVKVRLLVPAGVVVYAYGSMPDWQRELGEDSAGHVTAITWSGGSILPEEFAQFSFMARNPASTSPLVWKAYQSYSDGLVVAWTDGPNGQQPAAVTSLNGASAQAGTSSTTVVTANGDSSTTAEVGVALALLALSLSSFATGLLILALRRRVL